MIKKGLATSFIIFLISMILGSYGINFNNIYFSFESIIRKSVIWIIAIILVILFVRKIKDMDRE